MTKQWIPLTERLPTEDDADRFGDVEWWCKSQGIWQDWWDKERHPHQPTHWRKIVTPEDEDNAQPT